MPRVYHLDATAGEPYGTRWSGMGPGFIPKIRRLIMQELNPTQTQDVAGALRIKRITTLAIGEECSTVTTLAIGEEGNVYTTLALGEEGGGPVPSTTVTPTTSALGSF